MKLDVYERVRSHYNLNMKNAHLSQILTHHLNINTPILITQSPSNQLIKSFPTSLQQIQTTLDSTPLTTIILDISNTYHYLDYNSNTHTFTTSPNFPQ